MSKVVKKKLTRKDREKLSAIPSEKDKTMKATSKGKKATKEEINSLLQVVEKSKGKKGKVSKKVSAFSPSDIKVLFDENDLPSIITTKELTKLIMDETGYLLGQDLTAGSKNLRRHLRSLDRWNDDSVTTYRWNVKDKEDLSELAEILDFYSSKAVKIG